MSLPISHDELAKWLAERRYLSDSCHDAGFDGSLGKVVDGVLTPEQEVDLLRYTRTQPPGSAIYKDGYRSFVGACPVGDTILAHKYYHRLSVRRQLGYSMFGSRAMKAWIASRVFTKLGVETPQPIAIFEYRRFGLLTDSCLFVTEVAEGIPFMDYLEAHSEDEVKMDVVAASCKEIFDRLAAYRIYHRDTATKNFIVNDEGVVSVFDLDAVRILVSPMFWGAKRAKDKYRFMRSFRRFPHLEDKFAKVFDATGEKAGFELD